MTSKSRFSRRPARDTATFNFGISFADHASQIVEDCVGTLGETRGSLGFIYATDTVADEFQAVVAGLKAQTGVADWVGTVGLGITATAAEYYESAATTVMVTDLHPEDYRLIPSSVDEAQPLTAALPRHEDAVQVGIIHGDPSSPHTPELIDALAQEIPSCFLVGGLTSSRLGHQQVVASSRTAGVSGVLFAEGIPIIASHTQGCTPLPNRHRVTRCERNVLLELDGRPALDVFKEDIGELLARNLARVAGYIFVGLPIRGTDTADYLVRNLMAIEPQRKLLVVGDLLTEGQELMFCRRDGDSAREDLDRMLRDVTARLSRPAKGALYFSCLARGRNQFGEHSEELRTVSEALGNVPLVGFFANGEVFNNRLYGYTGVLNVFV